MFYYFKRRKTHVLFSAGTKNSIVFLRTRFGRYEKKWFEQKEWPLTRDRVNGAKWILSSDLSIFMIIVVRCAALPVFIKSYFLCFHQSALESRKKNSFNATRERGGGRINDSVFHHALDESIFISIASKTTQFVHQMVRVRVVCVCDSAFPWNERNDWARGIEIDAIKMEREKRKMKRNRNVEWSERVCNKDSIVESST